MQMTNAQLKCTTRHVRIFTAVVQDRELVPNEEHLTLDLDPDNEFLWTQDTTEIIHSYFQNLIHSYAGQELSEYNLRRIGSDIEGKIRELLQTGQLSYNPDCRVQNFSMGLPRTPELL